MSDENQKPVSTNPIALQPVSSSQLAAIGHDPITSTLAIRFTSTKSKPDEPGSLYHYGNFGADQFQQFVKAESKGAFFGANIKNNVARHPFVKIVEKKAE